MSLKVAKKNKILVGLSGGVDSFMTAYYLQKAGWQVIGVYLAMQKNKEQLLRVKKLINRLRIKLKIVFCQKEFQKKIIQPFVESYQKGETPNPCIWCNPLIKFNFLLRLAKKEKINNVATGHYARVVMQRENGKKIFYLKKGIDEKKDQSYFLYRLKQSDLKKIIFPLGEKKKEEVKKDAEKMGFYKNDLQNESQDVCFFPQEKKLADFLCRKIVSQPGKIKDERGKFLGEHYGLEKYTLGQRKGICLSGGPFFVVKKDFSKNELWVSKNKNLSVFWRKKINFKKVSWINDQPTKEKKYTLKIRYGQKETAGRIYQDEKKQWQALLEKAQWSPAVGQSLVIYDGEKVVGGGIIE